MSIKVKRMFDDVSERYDFLNTILSLGIHYSWKKRLVKLANINEYFNILDCATGTGDLALQFKKESFKGTKVFGLDFSTKMIEKANEKFQSNKSEIHLINADILYLPFKDHTFDIVSISFGIRNVDSPYKGIIEMARVLKSGGKIMILEFGQPKGFFSLIYKFYSKNIIPSIGRFFSGLKTAYKYLPETAAKFPCEDNFLRIMENTGMFKSCYFIKLSFGIAFIYIGIKK